MNSTRQTDPTPAPSQRLTVGNVARQLNVSEDTVRGWIFDGELRAADCSRKRGSLKPRWRISQADLAEFEVKRANQSALKIHRPRRKTVSGVTEYFA